MSKKHTEKNHSAAHIGKSDSESGAKRAENGPQRITENSWDHE